MFYRRTRFQRQLDGFCELCTISTRTKSRRSSGTLLTHWRKENTSEIKCGLSGHDKCLFILQCVDWKIVIQGSLHPCALGFLTSILNMFLEQWFCAQSTFMVGWTFCCFMDPNTKISFTQYFTPKYYYKLNIIIDDPIHCRLEKRFFIRPVRTFLLEKNYWCGMVILIIYSWEYQSVWRMTKTAHMRPVPSLKI